MSASSESLDVLVIELAPGDVSGTVSVTLDLLHEPHVAVGVFEGDEAVVVQALGMEPGLLAVLTEVERLARLDPALDQFGASGLDVGDDEVKTLQRARFRGADALADGDRACRPGRRQLHDPEVVAGTMVDVQCESDLLGVEVLGPVDV